MIFFGGLNKTIPNSEPIPKGRLTEDGVLSMKHNLQEMHTKSYPKRTEKNVIDFDGTVIFTHGKLTGGSLLTQEKANQYGVVSRNFLGFRLTTPFSSKENKILTISNPHSEK